MPAPKENIERPSITTPLTARYEQSTDLANVGGGSAKEAGTSDAATNMINGGAVGQEGNEWSQKQFVVKTGKGVTSFTQNGLYYATNILKVPTDKPYAPGGRLG